MVEALERRKDNMIAALWANSNFDDDRGSRQKAIEEIEEKYQEAILKIHGVEDEFEIDKSNPFFGQMREIPTISKPSNYNGTVEDVIGEYEVDQQ